MKQNATLPLFFVILAYATVFLALVLACSAPGIIDPTLPAPLPRLLTNTPKPTIIMSSTPTPSSTATRASTGTPQPLKTRTPTPSMILATILPSSTPLTYTVQRGDTLSAIAVRFCGEQAQWVRLARLNGMDDPNELSVGMTLIIECE